MYLFSSDQFIIVWFYDKNLKTIKYNLMKTIFLNVYILYLH